MVINETINNCDNPRSQQDYRVKDNSKRFTDINFKVGKNEGFLQSKDYCEVL